MNNALISIAKNAPKPVISAIEQASLETGVDFDYMVKQAHTESNFNPKARAKTSSATGLYQFVQSTWLDMIDKHGPKYGINPNQSRSELLNLRKDPEISSFMAAEFARENKDFLEKTWGGDVGSTELYFAHFMGAGGASSFLKARDKNGMQPASYLFPQAAKANYNVFYDRKGRSRSLDEVYALFDKKFDGADTHTQFANATGKRKSVVYEDQFDRYNRPIQTASAKKEPLKHNQMRIANSDEIITWNMPAKRTYQASVNTRTRSSVPAPYRISNPVDILMLKEMNLTGLKKPARA